MKTEIEKYCGSCAFYNETREYCLLTLEEHTKLDIPDCDKYKWRVELDNEFAKRKKEVKESLINKLKPCPFCGKKVNIMDDLFSKGQIIVYCNECHLSMTSKYNLEQVVEKWNNRVYE